MSVSYLISSYNKGEYLRAVLESALSEMQKTDGELVVVDDGSTDLSWEEITKFAQRDERIAIYRQPNAGVFHVTNRLLGLASQQWLRLVDSDDPLIGGSTAAMKRVGDAHAADYVFGGMVPYGPQLAPIATCEPCSYEGARVEILADPLLHAIVGFNHVPSAALIRRSAVPAQLALPEDLLSCQDLALALHILKHGRAAKLHAPVCWQLVGVSHRLSSREALTYHQTIEILRRFGEDQFDGRYQRVAQIKVLSRTMRWMRRNRLRLKNPLTYVEIYWAYVRAKAGYPLDWERVMTLAAHPLARDVDEVLKSRKIY